MASEAEQQITWASSNSTSVASGGSTTSDVLTLSAGVIQANLLLKADNGGTPADGDDLDFVLQYTVGDPDGASTDEYTTPEHSHVIRANTFLEDPALVLVAVPVPVAALQIEAQNQSGTNSITVSATLYEQTA